MVPNMFARVSLAEGRVQSAMIITTTVMTVVCVIDVIYFNKTAIITTLQFNKNRYANQLLYYTEKLEDFLQNDDIANLESWF